MSFESTGGFSEGSDGRSLRNFRKRERSLGRMRIGEYEVCSGHRKGVAAGSGGVQGVLGDM